MISIMLILLGITILCFMMGKMMLGYFFVFLLITIITALSQMYSTDAAIYLDKKGMNTHYDKWKDE